jgi:predicted ATPase/DNA-binding SARP family transcriptional activator
MWFSVLGPLQVRDDEGSTIRLGGTRQQSVLAMLLLDTTRSVAVDRLIGQIWGDSPPRGAHDTLYTYVSNLRALIGRDRVARSDVGYRLQPQDGDLIDAVEFEARLVAARRAAGDDAGRTVELVAAAMQLWRGRPYEGLDLPCFAPEVARLDELRLRGLEDGMEAELRAGRAPDVGSLQTLAAEHPYRERFWDLLARTLYRLGRQADALAALNRLRRTLAHDLGVEPSPALARLEERILVQDPTLDAGVPGSDLPVPLSSFVGREQDLDGAARHVLDDRLVTVLGPGGVGKSRMALELARQLGPAFPDGVWLVDLAPVPAAEGVPGAMSRVLGVAVPPGRGDAPLVRWARSRRTLLVLDNCEHVIGRVADLAVTMLASAPGLHVLATSRRPLEVAGEVIVPLAGLPVAHDATSIGDAERLFAQRASAAHPGFSLEASGTRHAARELCRRLDGLPLAIELAAARSDTLSPSEMAAHLTDGFPLLVAVHPSRDVHRTLQASLDWSRSLLPDGARDALDGVAVFEGRFTAQSAAAVLEVPLSDAAGLLDALVDASLLWARPGEPSHYQLPETVRRYARERSQGSRRWQNLVQRHDDHLRATCVGLREGIFGRGRTAARIEVEAQYADHEVAFDRALAGSRSSDALDMAWALGHVWLFTGALRAGLDRLERALRATADTATAARADALAVGSFLLLFVQRYDEAIAWADQAVGIYRALGDDRGLAYALARRGHLAFSVGEIPAAVGLLGQSLDACDRAGTDDSRAWPLTLLAQARLWGGNTGDEVSGMLQTGRDLFIEMGDVYGQVHATTFLANLAPATDRRRYLTEALRLAERPGADPLMRPLVLHNYAFLVWNQGERERAEGLNRLSARSALDMGVTVSVGMALLQASVFAGVGGDAERAAVLRGAGDRHFTMQMAPFWEEQLRPGVDAAVRALGESRYRGLHARGQAMSLDTAARYLLE